MKGEVDASSRKRDELLTLMTRLENDIKKKNSIRGSTVSNISPTRLQTLFRTGQDALVLVLLPSPGVQQLNSRDVSDVDAGIFHTTHRRVHEAEKKARRLDDEYGRTYICCGICRPRSRCPVSSSAKNIASDQPRNPHRQT